MLIENWFYPFQQINFIWEHLVFEHCCLFFIAALMFSIDEVKCLYNFLYYECYLEMT